MKKKLFLFRTRASFLFFDCLGVLVGENWQAMRKESSTLYKLIKITYAKNH